MERRDELVATFGRQFDAVLSRLLEVGAVFDQVWTFERTGESVGFVVLSLGTIAAGIPVYFWNRRRTQSR